MTTTSYHDKLIEALGDPEEAHAYLSLAIMQYLDDLDREYLLQAIDNIAEGLTKHCPK